MPPVIIAANLIAASAISAATTIAAITGLTVAQVGLLAATAAYGIYQKRRMAKKALSDYNKSLTDRLTMVATTDAARSIILGRARNTDGVLFKGTWGPKREANFTMVVALAGHEVDAIETVYFADQAVDIDGSGLVTTAPYGQTRRESKHIEVPTTPGVSQTVDLGVVPLAMPSITYGVRRQSINPTSASGTTVTFTAPFGVETVTIAYQVQESTSYARVYKYRGAPGQNLSGMLASRFGDSLITSAHRFEGIACLVVDMRWNDSAFPNGIPAVSAVVRGARLHDPRTGFTAWSDNPALCARYVALHPWLGGAAVDEIDDTSVIAAANACDVSHTYTDSTGASTTRVMYTCSYVASTEVGGDTHMNEVVEAMAGQWGWAGGRIRMRAGVYTAPVAHITDDWIGPGQRQINTGPGQADLINVMVPTIADATQERVSTPIAPVRAEPYIDADGRELSTDITLGAVEFAPQAQHICAIRLREMRQGVTLQWPVNMRGFALELFDNVTLTSARYGFPAKPFEVVGWSFNLQGGIQLSLRETGASIYQPDDEFPANDPEPNTSLPVPWDVQAMSGLGVVSGTSELLLQSDGSVVSRARVTFDPITDEAVLNGGTIEVAYSDNGGGRWQSETFPGDSQFVWLLGLRDDSYYLFKARAKTRLATGEWSPQILRRVLGKAEPPPLPDSFTIRTMPDGTRVLEGGYTAATRPIDLAGYRIRYRQGSGPYELSEMLPFQTDDGFFTVLPIETNLLMAGTYTLALVGVDTSRNESAPLFIMAVLPNPRLGDAVAYRILQSEGWPGTRSDCVLDVDGTDVVLRAREQAVWDDFTGPWDSYTRWVWHPVSTWTYVVSDDDFGAAVSVLPIVAFDGVGDVDIEEQHSDDAVTWSSWAPIAAAIVARYVRIRATVTATGPTGPGVTQLTYLRSMSVIYTGNATVETINDLDPSALPGAQRLGPGDYLLPTSRTFITVTELAVTLQGVGGNWSWSIVTGERNDKHIRVYSGGTLADPPLIDYSVRGIAL